MTTRIEIDGHLVIVSPAGRDALLRIYEQGRIHVTEVHPSARARLLNDGLVSLRGNWMRTTKARGDLVATELMRIDRAKGTQLAMF